MTEELYRPTFEQLATLPDLRAEVDSYDGIRDLEHGTNASYEIQERYGDVVHSFFDASTRIAASVRDTDLRIGTELINLASRQIDVNTELTINLVFSQLTGSGIDTRQELPAVGRAFSTYEAQAAAIVTGSTGDYRPSPGGVSCPRTSWTSTTPWSSTPWPPAGRT